jgi:L-alanine-DL-glutamate epimerase-like enolase superfamily enzyme
VPDASFRLDANAGFDAATALELLQRARAAGLHVECFEQPCAAGDLDAMARVTREAGVPVVADESVKTLADLNNVLAARAASGVNLKLVKSGGLLAAYAIGLAARAAGLQIMCGGMVETRLGMSAMAHVACALGGVDYVDLDTAFLLAAEPFSGGYRAEGASLRVGTDDGLGVVSLP